MSLRCDQTPEWPLLQAHFSTDASQQDLRQSFAQDAQRFDHFSQSAPHVFADLSKNLWSRDTEALLLDMARHAGVEQHRDAMLGGQSINTTEGRAVLHTLLRRPAGLALPGDQSTVAADLARVHTTLDAMLAYADAVRADDAITDVVNIGIGGSDLGPHMAVLALEEFRAPGKRFHFVSNVDGHELHTTLRALRPESTLFLIASKTFTTAETMTNARSALAWFAAQGGRGCRAPLCGAHHQCRCRAGAGHHHHLRLLGLGGRALFAVVGHWPAAGHADWCAGFRDLLAGAHAMDEHFRTAPLAQNLPVRLGLLDVWYRNFHGFTSRCIAPYHAALRRLPAYLQQLEMESNGKRVGLDGQPLPYATSPVLWGEPGTNGQHAFFQMLHQGTDVLPLELIAVRQPTAPPGGPPQQAAGQRPGAGPGADGGQRGRRRPPPLSGQPAQHVPAAGCAHACIAGRADRAAGTPRVRERQPVGHQ